MSAARVLIVGLNYAPEPVGIGPYTAGLAEALAERGHQVTVIAGQPYYPQWRKDPAYTDGWRRGTEQGVTVTRCPHYVPREPTGLRRIVHLASFALSALGPALRAAIGNSRPEVVIVIAPAVLSVLTAWLAARLCGAPLWIHVQDFEVEAALATGLIDSAGLTARIARRLETWLLKLGDRVSTISPQMVSGLVAKGLSPDRVMEIRNWSDPRFAVEPEAAAALREQWGIGQRKVALYSGNIARKQGIEILIEAARLLKARTDLVFVICGEGPNRANLTALAADLPNVLLRDLQPAERMGALLGLADVHLLPQIAEAADLVLPSKLTNMLASGRPVLATAATGTGLHAEVEGCGVLVAPGDAAALAAALAGLTDDDAERARLGLAALARAQERWTRSAILAQFESGLGKLLRRS